jgi:hypothetical protein
MLPGPAFIQARGLGSLRQQRRLGVVEGYFWRMATTSEPAGWHRRHGSSVPAAAAVTETEWECRMAWWFADFRWRSFSRQLGAELGAADREVGG